MCVKFIIHSVGEDKKYVLDEMIINIMLYTYVCSLLCAMMFLIL